MPLRLSHDHEFVPARRINRVVISKCKKCEVTKSDLIRSFSKSHATLVDELIERIKQES